jgi:hypothetical protein
MPVSRPSRGVLALLEMVVGCLWKLTMTAGYSIGSDMKYNILLDDEIVMTLIHHAFTSVNYNYNPSLRFPCRFN